MGIKKKKRKSNKREQSGACSRMTKKFAWQRLSGNLVFLLWFFDWFCFSIFFRLAGYVSTNWKSVERGWFVIYRVCDEWTCYCWPTVMVTMMMMYIETLYIDRALSFHRVIHHCRRTARRVTTCTGCLPDAWSSSGLYCTLLVSQMRNWISRLWLFKFFSLVRSILDYAIFM